jgi:hypothetical protein
VGATSQDELRGSSYPVRVSFDERGWTGWVRLRTGQELSIRGKDLARLGTALTELVAVIDGTDPATMTVEPTWDVTTPGHRIGLVLVPAGGDPGRGRRPSPPRPPQADTLDTRSARRIVAAMADATAPA